MFDNIGAKLKGLAKFLTFVGFIAFGVIGIFIAGVLKALFIGIAVIVIGAVVSWLSSFVMYGIGQLIENSDTLIELKRAELRNLNLKHQNEDSNKWDEYANEIAILDDMRGNGLLTDEEYDEKLSELQNKKKR